VEKRGLLHGLSKPIFFVTGGFFFLFVILSVIDIEMVGSKLSAAVTWLSTTFGWLFGLVVFVVVLANVFLMCTKYGDIKMGKPDDKPEFSTFNWLAILFTTAIAAGAVFYGSSEPIWHMMTIPPVIAEQFGIQPGTVEAATYGMAFSFFHWGIGVWALYSLVGVGIGYCHFVLGLPLRPSSIFIPFMGEKISAKSRSIICIVIDILCIIAIITGQTVAPGVMTKQLAYSFR